MNILTERNEALFVELNLERQTVKDLREQLDQAETALKFYGNPKHYLSSREGEFVFQNQVQGDFSFADNDPKTKIAGARAREYFNKEK